MKSQSKLPVYIRRKIDKVFWLDKYFNCSYGGLLHKKKANNVMSDEVSRLGIALRLNAFKIAMT